MHASRRLAVGAILAGTALVLSGCSGGDAEQQTEGTLSFYTDKGAWEPNFEALNDPSSAAIDIDLDVTGYSDQPQYQAFIRQSFRTDESPGLFTWTAGPQLEELVDDGLIAPTSDIWDEAIEEGWVSEDLAADYTFDGEQYCVPMNIAYWVMYYSVPIFEQYGLTPPTTFAELEDISQTLIDNGVTPMYQTSTLFSFVWFETMVAGTDPELYAGLNDGSVEYTDPRVVDIMDQWLDQQEAGWFTDAASQTDPAVMLNTGEMAMINFGTFFGASLDGVGMEPGVDYDMFVIPAVDPSLDTTPIAVETGPLCTAASSPQRDMGLAYARWWMSPEAQTAWGAERGDVPFNPMADVTNQQLADLGTEISTGDYTLFTRYFEAAPTEVLTVALEQLGAFTANPSDPMPYLETIQQAADEAFAE